MNQLAYCTGSIHCVERIKYMLDKGLDPQQHLTPQLINVAKALCKIRHFESIDKVDGYLEALRDNGIKFTLIDEKVANFLLNLE